MGGYYVIVYFLFRDEWSLPLRMQFHFQPNLVWKVEQPYVAMVATVIYYYGLIMLTHRDWT